MTSDSEAPKQGLYFHKRIRLDPESYGRTADAYSVTIATLNRRPIFADASCASSAVKVLHDLAAVRSIRVYCYCVMPDHVHMVVSPSPICDIPTFVGQYKNLTQREVWRLGNTGVFWQKSFWDRIVRSDESLQETIRYVLNNPVRRGLVSAWEEYAFVGWIESAWS
jgi:putative transposase